MQEAVTGPKVEGLRKKLGSLKFRCLELGSEPRVGGLGPLVPGLGGSTLQLDFSVTRTLLSAAITRLSCHCQREAKLTGTGSRQEVCVGQIEVYRGWAGSPQGTDRKSTG